jgi:hypothetical protein
MTYSTVQYDTPHILSYSLKISTRVNIFLVHADELLLTEPAVQITVCTSIFADFFLFLPLEVHVSFAIIKS